MAKKKVNVSVNGHPIPFNMKIGEAGEAFFVFEMDGDIPDELITSPILHPTRPDESKASANVKGPELEPKLQPDDQDVTRVKNEESILKQSSDDQEPDFLDLDAQPSKPVQLVPGLPSPPLTPTHQPSNLTPEISEQEQRVDAALLPYKDHIDVPQVSFHGDVALDVEGYHSHRSGERSDRIIGSSEPAEFTFPTRSKTRSATPSPVRGLENDLELPDSLPLPVTFPMFRAASEPPPDIGEHSDATSSSQNQASSSKMKLSPLSPVQEYSWEWGAFPQPSPVSASFTKGGRMEMRSWVKGKGKANELQKSGIVGSNESDEENGASINHEHDHVRSRSVPPELEGSPQRRLKELVERYDAFNDLEDGDVDEASFGKGGILRPSKRDPNRFALQIEGRRIMFELSVVSTSEGQSDGALSDLEEGTRPGWRSRHERVSDFMIFDGRDEVEAARLFALGKVDYDTFIYSDDVVENPWLVIRWAGNQYITRRDGSPLMNALVVWRNATLQQRALQPPSRPTSPVSDGDINEIRPTTPPLPSDEQQPEERHHHRSKSEPPEEAQGTPTSSWVRWWSRSKKTVAPNEEQPDTAPLVKQERPSMRESSSVPVENKATITQDIKRSSKEIPTAESAPAYPSTVWDSTDLVVVSDIDGTITKSDGLGHVFAMIGRDWTHLGVAKLYTDITRNGYKIMYLTSRAIGQADATRAYLEGIKQNNYQLPEGPVIMSPDRLMTSLHREVILRKPEVFKMACLRDIQRLFGEASRNPFYAGFGNRITDALSYRSVNVPSARIFTIDSTGEVKMELLELAGYKSSYIHMTDLVDQMFPPIHRKWTPEFTDFNYWKTPVQDFPLPDLSPPSPALSARSDTSTLARLRNFSLVSGRQSSTPVSRASPSPDEHRGRSSHLRQMSSLERLSSTLGWNQMSNDGRRSASPASLYDSDDEGASDGEGGHKRERRRSMTSMPGTLDEMHFGMDDDDEPFYGSDNEDEDGEAVHEAEEAGEEDFDEDLLVAGEMKNVPFL
ncbi:hypothetical protein C0992_007038 [Termitomyces sp. T32_za158]|nr:hypothetical protein C0992_007038 [Termitomyces sp. T32_za158]